MPVNCICLHSSKTEMPFEEQCVNIKKNKGCFQQLYLYIYIYISVYKSTFVRTFNYLKYLK